MTDLCRSDGCGSEGYPTVWYIRYLVNGNFRGKIPGSMSKLWHSGICGLELKPWKFQWFLVMSASGSDEFEDGERFRISQINNLQRFLTIIFWVCIVLARISTLLNLRKFCTDKLQLHIFDYFFLDPCQSSCHSYGNLPLVFFKASPSRPWRWRRGFL